MEKTKMVQLEEIVKEYTDEKIVKRVTRKTGEDNEPIVLVEIDIPKAFSYSGLGKTIEEAENKAAEEALWERQWVLENS